VLRNATRSAGVPFVCRHVMLAFPKQGKLSPARKGAAGVIQQPASRG